MSNAKVGPSQPINKTFVSKGTSTMKRYTEDLPSHREARLEEELEELEEERDALLEELQQSRKVLKELERKKRLDPLERYLAGDQ